MTIQTRGMFGKLGHVRKSGVAFTNYVPVFGRHFMTRIAREFLFADVRGVRKV